ncbi:hypothetical protein HWV62_23893 [Athelia sp. TMB]|nr:hypothetical protein HWV62_23893 [Athelia sp. TMB]
MPRLIIFLTLHAAQVLGYDEAMSWVQSGRWSISSPNMLTIAFFPIEKVSLRLRSDGRFADEDFTITPQVFTSNYAHRILVRRHPGNHCEESVMWWTPEMTDFLAITQSSYQALGRLRSECLRKIDAMTWNLSNRAYNIISRNPRADWAALEALISNMRHGVLRLKHSPYTFKEVKMDVAQTQRLYLDALAMCDYVEDKWANKLQSVGPVLMPPRSEYMGAWTSDPSVVQKLHHAGIPVYFVQDRSIVTNGNTVWVEGGPWRRDNLVVTAELGVVSQIITSMQRHHSSINMATSMVTSLHWMAQNRRSRGSHVRTKVPKTGLSIPSVRDKWSEITGDYIPHTVKYWAEALRAVDRNQRQGTVAPKHYTGYRFPDPGMLVFSAARREKNLFNWLLVRDANIHRLMNDLDPSGHAPRGFSNEVWRMLLGVEFTDRDKVGASLRDLSLGEMPSTRSSSHAERRQAAIAIFGQPPDSHNYTEVQWRGHFIGWDTFFKHDPALVQEIMWDIHQYSFQYDLISLDHYMRGDDWRRDARAQQCLISKILGRETCLVVEDLPAANSGIASEIDENRFEVYRALEQLMACWPSSSDIIDGGRNTDSYCATVVRIFCQAFYKAAAHSAKDAASGNGEARNVPIQKIDHVTH